MKKLFKIKSTALSAHYVSMFYVRNRDQAIKQFYKTNPSDYIITDIIEVSLPYKEERSGPNC